MRVPPPTDLFVFAVSANPGDPLGQRHMVLIRMSRSECLVLSFFRVVAMLLLLRAAVFVLYMLGCT